MTLRHKLSTHERELSVFSLYISTHSVIFFYYTPTYKYISTLHVFVTARVLCDVDKELWEKRIRISL